MAVMGEWTVDLEIKRNNVCVPSEEKSIPSTSFLRASWREGIETMWARDQYTTCVAMNMMSQ